MTSFRSLLICLMLCIAPNAFGGTITGRVLDKDQQPVIGAAVQIEALKIGAITNHSGTYTLKNVPLGTYVVKIRSLGYKTDWAKKVIVTGDDQSVTLNIELEQENLVSADIIVEDRAERSTEVSARLSEKNASNITNVVTSELIDHSADRTSADALQHISGLSVERDQGEGRFVIFRGMAQRYNNTLVNGIKIPSPEPKVRFVPIDLIPSELLQRIEVTKALTPDMEGDAIGGTANLLLKDAPDKPILDVTLGSGYNSFLFNNKFVVFDRSTITEDPGLKAPGYAAQASDFSRNNMKYSSVQAPPDGIYSLTAGSRFLDNSFGVILSGSLQNTFRRTEGTRFDLTSNPNNVDSNHLIEPTYHQQNDRSYSTYRSRLGINAKADYIFDPANQIDFNYNYFNLSELEARHIYSAILDNTRAGPSITIKDRSNNETQLISSFMLEGHHRPSDEWSLKWVAAYSDAKRNQQDIPEITLTQNKTPEGQIDPRVSFFDVFRYWQNNDDRDKLGTIDLEYNPIGSIFTFKTGGLLRLKDRVNYDNEYTFNPDPAAGVLAQEWKGIDSVKWVLYDNSGTSQFGYNNYNANETVAAGYLQSTVRIGALQILGGARVEGTQQGYTTKAPATLNATAATIKYFDFLPSLHFKYELTDQQNLRLSYTNTLSRPSYFELVPYEIRDKTTGLLSRGNYQLRRTKATNLDLRYEFYPNLSEVLTGGIFYKRIVDPIELAFDGSNASEPYIQPRNLGTATDMGFELVATKIFREFQASVNYTFTKSLLVSDKYTYVRYGTASAYNVLSQQERPLEGQAQHILNATLAFHYAATGTYLEIGYGFTSKRLILVSPAMGYDQYQNPTSDLDFSFEQNLTSSLIAYGKFNNLLNSPYEVVNSYGLLLEREYYRQNFEIGVHYRY